MKRLAVKGFLIKRKVIGGNTVLYKMNPGPLTEQ